MRAAVLPVVMLLGGLMAKAAEAQTFCAVNHEGATNCTFASIERCRDEVQADGGFCIPQAPTGHRQPRARDLPANIPPDPSDQRLRQQNSKLDRDLRLCRGC